MIFCSRMHRHAGTQKSSERRWSSHLNAQRLGDLLAKAGPHGHGRSRLRLHKGAQPGGHRRRRLLYLGRRLELVHARLHTKVDQRFTLVQIKLKPALHNKCAARSKRLSLVCRRFSSAVLVANQDSAIVQRAGSVAHEDDICLEFSK